ncbi:hypothetical protein BH20ACI1_BH20ACI1_04090 [soil metagenome]
MKIVRTTLIIFGILLFLIGLGLGFLLMMGSALPCKHADERQKEADARLQSYQTAKAKATSDYDIKVIDSEKELKNAIDSLKIAQNACASEQSSRRFGIVIAVLLTGLGVVLSIIGFFIGRKKAVP